MKKSFAFFTILALAVLAFVLGASEGPGEENPGSTQQTVTSQFYGLAGCFALADAYDYDHDITYPWYYCPWWIDTCAEAYAGASAYAMAFVVAEVSADTQLTITRHGKHGAVHQIELDSTLANATIHLSTSIADASAWVEAQGEEFAEWYWSVYAEAYAWFADAYSSAYGGSWYDADAEAGAGASASAYATSYSSSASGQDTGVSVKGANIREFEAGLTMNAHSFVSTQASSYVDVIADAFAHASAHAYASAYAYAYALGSYDWDYDYKDFYFSGWSDAFAFAAADSYAATLASATYSVNVTAGYENLPGIHDFLEIVTVNSSSLSCGAGAGAGAFAYANAINY